MNNDLLQFQPIGIIRTPFKQLSGMPIQPSGAEGIKGEIQLDPDLIVGLKDLDGFSHLILLYCFHHSTGFDLTVEPFMDDKRRGVFATRAPKRPNPIGISVVELESIHDNLIKIKNVDMLDGTPLLDIKPFIPQIDQPDSVKLGWLEDKVDDFNDAESDNRFLDD
jgi:tRNA-Thr(GGU) m(6)t(6)A37 methyltransferase TsaA